PTVALLSELVYQVGDLPLRQPRKQLPGGFAVLGVEPQIQFAFRLEAEPPLAIGKLIAREAEVEQDAVEAMGEAELLEHFWDFVVAGMHNGDIRQARHPRTSSLGGRRIAIQPDYAARGADEFGDAQRVTAGSKCSIAHHLARLQSEALEHLLHHHGDVQRW